MANLSEPFAPERRRRPRRHLVLLGALSLWFGLAIVAIAYVAQALVGPSLARMDPGAATLALILFVGALLFVSERVIRALL